MQVAARRGTSSTPPTSITAPRSRARSSASSSAPQRGVVALGRRPARGPRCTRTSPAAVVALGVDAGRPRARRPRPSARRARRPSPSRRRSSRARPGRARRRRRRGGAAARSRRAARGRVAGSMRVMLTSAASVGPRRSGRSANASNCSSSTSAASATRRSGRAARPAASPRGSAGQRRRRPRGRLAAARSGPSRGLRGSCAEAKAPAPSTKSRKPSNIGVQNPRVGAGKSPVAGACRVGNRSAGSPTRRPTPHAPLHPSRRRPRGRRRCSRWPRWPTRILAFPARSPCPRATSCTWTRTPSASRSTRRDGEAWSLVAPRAEPLRPPGRRIAAHFAGPTWQAKDGSKVVGAARQRRQRRSVGDRLAAAVRRVDGPRSPRRRPRSSSASTPPAASSPAAGDCHARVGRAIGTSRTPPTTASGRPAGGAAATDPSNRRLSGTFLVRRRGA